MPVSHQTGRRLPKRLTAAGLLVLLAAGLVTAAAAAAELQDRTARAWEAYIVQAQQVFVERVRNGSPLDLSPSTLAVLRSGAVLAGPADGDGILNVPGGLIHHWIGRAFIPGATLRLALDISQDYTGYPMIYKPVLSARVVERDGDRFGVLVRVREGAGGISAVLDIRSNTQYVRPGDGRAYTVSRAQEIRQVQDAGQAGERLLPAGHDSGYLWRAGTFTAMAEGDGGVYVEMETVGLSRGFPPLLGWIIEPIARRLGRKSVEASLQEFRDAVVEAAAPLLEADPDPPAGDR